MYRKLLKKPFKLIIGITIAVTAIVCIDHSLIPSGDNRNKEDGQESFDINFIPPQNIGAQKVDDRGDVNDSKNNDKSRKSTENKISDKRQKTDPDNDKAGNAQETSDVNDDTKGSRSEAARDIAFEDSDHPEAGDSNYYRGGVGGEEEDYRHGNQYQDLRPDDEQLQEEKNRGQLLDDIGGKDNDGVVIDNNQQLETKNDRKNKRRKGPETKTELVDDFTADWNITEEMRRLAPVMFKYVPPKFLPDYQGFCWLTAEQSLRCLPYFYLLGMPKCGTTDIWDRLVEHPHITRVLKEPHWWTRSNRLKARVYISRSISTVKRMKQRPSEASKYILGDGSASTFWDMRRWQIYFNPDDPKLQTFLPHVIRTITPNAKLIAAFREPVSRLYSEYVYFSQSPSPESFHDRVLGRIADFEKCTRSYSKRRCVYQSAMENGDIRPMIGVYSVFARDWLEVFPRDQMLFIRLEDWHLHCMDYLPKIFEFLEVEKLDDKSIQKICNMKTKNVNRKKSNVGPILEKTKNFLRQLYRDWNEDLAELLGEDRWLWSNEND